MSGSPRPLAAIVIVTSMLAGLLVAPPPAHTAAGEQTVTVDVSGGLDYSAGGTTRSGHVAMSALDTIVDSVQGTVEIPGAAAGNATVSFDLRSLLLFPVYIGSITIDDPGTGFTLTSPVLTGAVRGTVGNLRGTSQWFAFTDLVPAAYRIAWTIKNHAACNHGQPATFGQAVGVNTHYPSAGEVNSDALARLADAGVAFIRNDLTWEKVEKEPGVYDFAGSGYDRLVSTSEELGLRILFILDYGNPLHGGSQTHLDAEGRRAFAEFAAAAAHRYGGRGHAWELWNEPNVAVFGTWTPEQYAELIRTTAPALRGADPTGKIVAGALLFGVLSRVTAAIGLGTSGPEFLERLAATDALSLVDEVTIHLYRVDGPEGAANDIGLACDILRRAGHPLPISSGEWGYSTYNPHVAPTGINYLPAVSPERQASNIARMLLLNYSSGLRHSVIFKDTDGAEPGNIEHHFGIMTEAGDPKPALEAVATLVDLLGNAGPPEALPARSGGYALQFSPPGEQHITVLWATRPTTWTLQATGTGARVVSRNGTDITPPGLSNVTQLTLGTEDGPIYLIGDIEMK